MHHSRSDSGLSGLPSVNGGPSTLRRSPSTINNVIRPSTQQSMGGGGTRLTPVKSSSARPSPTRVRTPQEEKQQQQASPSPFFQFGKTMRIVDSNGRPFDAPDPTTPSPASHHHPSRSTSSPSRLHGSPPPSFPRVDADGLPILSILSPDGLKSSDGDMSTILLSKVKKQSQANLTILSAAKGSQIHNEQKARKLRAAQVEAWKASELIRSGVSRNVAYQPTGLSGRPTLVSDSRLNEVEAPSPHAYNGGKVKVTDFTGDGGMGGRIFHGGSSLLEDEEERNRNGATTNGGVGGIGSNLIPHGIGDYSSTGSNNSAANPTGLPSHLHTLSTGVSAKSASLRSQLRGLDLLSTAFGQLIEEVRSSKGNLARLLTRVRDNYRLLFTNVIEEMLDMNQTYHTSLKGCISDYKSLQARMDGKVAHLEHRVRLLTSISTSKDNLIELNEVNMKQLETEMKDLKESIVMGIKSATLKVETASNAIVEDATAHLQAVATAAAMSSSSPSASGSSSSAGAGGPQANNGSNSDSIMDGVMNEGTNFSNSSAVDALTNLSHESRNLTFELAELIQNVETQQERSAFALDSLDTLLEKGIPHMEELAHDAAQRQRLIQNKAVGANNVNGSTNTPIDPAAAPINTTAPAGGGAGGNVNKLSIAPPFSNSPLLQSGSPIFRQRSLNTLPNETISMTLERSPILNASSLSGGGDVGGSPGYSPIQRTASSSTIGYMSPPPQMMPAPALIDYPPTVAATGSSSSTSGSPAPGMARVSSRPSRLSRPSSLLAPLSPTGSSGGGGVGPTTPSNAIRERSMAHEAIQRQQMREEMAAQEQAQQAQTTSPDPTPTTHP